MKKLLFYFVSLFFFVLMSCTEEEGVNPPAGEKAINEIVTALENKEEISDFVEILKKVDVANLTEDKLTVFAVRNLSSAARSASAVLDSVSIKRHIAKGSYAKADLTDGKELESINGEKLYITRNGDEVYVNGVIIEGEAIPAGNSYIYIVPEVLEEKTEPENFYTTTINVRELIWGQNQDKPLEGVNVVVNEAGKDSLDRWTEGEFIGEWKTDVNGQVIVKHTANEIVFWVYKDGYTDRYKGYIFKGVDADGKFIFYDTNADGLINNYDKYFFINNYYVENDKGETERTGTAYMVAIDNENVELPLPEPSSVENLWQNNVYYYMSENVYLDSKLTKETDSFRYNSIDFSDASLDYWKSAYNTIDWGISCIESLENASGYDDLADKIRTDVYLIWTQLFGYYSQIVDYYSIFPIDRIVNGINGLIGNAGEDNKYALYMMLAKIYLLEEKYDEVKEYCDIVIKSNNYKYGDIVWGGYTKVAPEPSDTVNVLKYDEVLLMKSCACLNKGNIPEGLNCFNGLLEYLGQEPVSSYSSSDLMNLAKNLLQGTGQLYPYARILEGSFEVPGFDANKNRLLPIPIRALETYPTLKQNEGY